MVNLANLECFSHLTRKNCPDGSGLFPKQSKTSFFRTIHEISNEDIMLPYVLTNVQASVGARGWDLNVDRDKMRIKKKRFQVIYFIVAKQRQS